MATDKELVKQIQQGNREAYGKLFADYYRQIYAICLSILKSPEDAEEIAQESFIHAYLNLGELQKPGSFFLWLKEIARNRSRDHIRRAVVRMAQSNSAPSQLSSTAPDERLLRQELINAITEAIEVLPTEDRKVVQARIDGLSHKEISERFGISAQASLSRLYRARKKLAGHLKGLYSIFSLVGKLCPKAIMSGGIVAMKIGTGAKVTIGVISVLAVGFIGFQIATRQPDQEVSPPDQAIQEVSTQSLKTPKTSQQTPDEKEIQTQTDSTTALPDSSEGSVTAEEAKDFLAFLDQMDNQESSEETVDPKEKKQASGLTDAKRAEIEARRAVLEEEIKTEMIRIISIGDKIQEYVQSGQNDDAMEKWCAEADKDVRESWMDLHQTKIGKYIGLGIILEGKSFKHPLARGGSLYEMGQLLPLNVIPRNFDNANLTIY